MVREREFLDGFILPTITRPDFRLGNNTDGALDELRLFDRELSAVEVESRFVELVEGGVLNICLLYTSPSPRDQRGSRMPSSA